MKETWYEFEKCPGGIRLLCYHGEEEKVVIPDAVDGFPVRILGKRMFYEEGMYIRSITVPPTVRKIEEQAFEMCIFLAELNLPDGMEEIGRGFLRGTELEELKVPASVRKIDGFEEITCSLRMEPGNPVYVSDGYGIYEEGCLVYADPNSSRKSYQVPDGCRKISGLAFVNQPVLEEVKIPSSVTEIGETAFHNIKDPYQSDRGIRSVRISEDNPVYGEQDGIVYERLPDDNFCLFHYASKESVLELPEEFTEIAAEAFAGSGIRSLTVTERMTDIRKDAFFATRLEWFRNGRHAIYFPQSDAYLLKELLREFGKGGELYDFSVYDRTLFQGYLNADRIRMLLYRLGDLSGPDDPEGKKREAFREILAAHMNQAMQVILAENDTELLRMLADAGFLTDDNIDSLIAQVNETDQKEILAFLMDYKNAHFSRKEFDFSL